MQLVKLKRVESFDTLRNRYNVVIPSFYISNCLQHTVTLLSREYRKLNFRCMATVNRLPSETTKLLHLQTVSRYRLTPSRSKLSLKSVCKWSPAVGLIFAWTFVIGVMYKGADIVTRVITEGLEDIGVLKINSTVDLLIAIYGLLAIVNMFYPLGGLLADVWCGRYRMVATSIFFLWLCLALVTVFAIVHVSTNGTTTKIVQVVFLALSFVMFIPAYAGYTSLCRLHIKHSSTRVRSAS